MSRMKATPTQITELTEVQCYGCGWKGMLAESAQSIYIDMRPQFQIPASQGGNGKNYRCPLCKQLIFYTRSDHTRKNIAPEGRTFRSVV